MFGLLQTGEFIDAATQPDLMGCRPATFALDADRRLF